MEQEKSQFQLWEWVKAISTLVLVGVVAYKIYITPTSLTVDFPTLLSLLLALFSVALSALFYFKATETSNTFYDNTYKFTKDIAELLVKIESGFGERLRNLDEGYSSMRNYFQNIPSKSSDDVEKTKKELETEKQEVKKVVVERNEIIQRLVEQSQLQEEEKQRVLAELKAKEEELSQSQHEVNKLNKRLFMERIAKRSDRERSLDLESGLASFTFDRVIREIGIEKVLGATPSILRRKFEILVADLPRVYIDDLKRHGLFDDGRLTMTGVRFLQEIAARRLG